MAGQTAVSLNDATYVYDSFLAKMFTKHEQQKVFCAIKFSISELVTNVQWA